MPKFNLAKWRTVGITTSGAKGKEAAAKFFRGNARAAYKWPGQ